MKQLNKEELLCVAGGDYQMVISGHVPSPMAGWMTNLFSQLITGQIYDELTLQQFLNYAQTNGANWNEVRIEDVSYSNFN